MNFEAFLNEALRDKFVCGLKSQSIRKRLLAERNLTLTKALEVAHSLEEADNQSKLISENSFTEPSFAHKLYKHKQLQSSSPPQRQCYRCNDPSHLANKCRFKQSICNKCNTKGHLAKAYRKSSTGRQNMKQEHAKQFGTEEKTSASESESDDNESEVYDLKQVRGDNVFITSLCVNNKNIEFEIDTGASLTIISEELFNESFKNTGLHSSNIILKTYSGEKLNVMGKFPVPENKHNGEVYNHSIYVVKGSGSAFLGRDMLTKIKLDWLSVNKVDNSLEILLRQYPALFSDRLGKMKDFQAKIHVKEGATPKFSKAQNVPFALQDAIIKELERLENEEILKPVSYSEWASPIVILPKPDGHIRICADYKRTVNPHIELYLGSVKVLSLLYKNQQLALLWLINL